MGPPCTSSLAKNPRSFSPVTPPSLQLPALAVVRQQHAVVADEHAAVAPLGNAVRLPNLGLAFPLVPGELDGRHVPPRAVFVGGAHRGGSQLFVRRRAGGLDGKGRLELEGP